MIAELPEKIAEFSGDLSVETVRDTVEAYTQLVGSIYGSLADRGDRTWSRVRSASLKPGTVVDALAERAETRREGRVQGRRHRDGRRDQRAAGGHPDGQGCAGRRTQGDHQGDDGCAEDSSRREGCRPEVGCFEGPEDVNCEGGVGQDRVVKAASDREDCGREGLGPEDCGQELGLQVGSTTAAPRRAATPKTATTGKSATGTTARKAAAPGRPQPPARPPPPDPPHRSPARTPADRNRALSTHRQTGIPSGSGLLPSDQRCVVARSARTHAGHRGSGTYPYGVGLITPIIEIVTWILAIGGAIAGVFAAVDAATRRSDAFAAADKQTKGTWAGITVACAVVLGLAVFGGAFAPQSLLWLAGLTGSLVYLLDVRPRLREVQRGGRW